MRKVIFLDVDGVLNCSTTTERIKGSYYGLEADKVRLFANIVHETGAEVVLSSSWRLSPDFLEAVTAALRVEGVELAGVTLAIVGLPGALRILGQRILSLVNPHRRGVEIMAWLAEHAAGEEVQVVILDDDNPAGSDPAAANAGPTEQRLCATWVQTWFTGGGLRPEHVEQIRDHFASGTADWLPTDPEYPQGTT